MSGRIQFQFELGGKPAFAPRESRPRRILILADCLGQQTGPGKLADRKILPVDVDNFDEVLARISPHLEVPLDDTADSGVRIDFRRLDDFHPDELFRKLQVFKALREMRGRLENPTTFAAAAGELKRGMTNSLATPLQPTVPQPPDAPATTEGTGGSLFEQLLGKASAESRPATAPQNDAVQRLIRQIVEPHLAKGADPGEQRQWLAVIDDAIAQLMRRILHHAPFQRLESVWRGIRWLIDRIEDSEALKLFLLDASETELAADLAEAEGNVERTQLYRLLSQNSVGVPGGEPWSLVLGAYTFGADVESLDLLELLGAVSAGCVGIFVGAAHPALLGCPSLPAAPHTSDWHEPPAGLAERWQHLRLSPVAQQIGLALPRFMLRLPYGEKSEPVESFRFEEMPAHPPHEAYLWGNPAFACGTLIGEAWMRGEALTVGTLREIGELPYYVYADGIEKVMKPCAEVYLNEKTANEILGRGIIPLLSVQTEELRPCAKAANHFSAAPGSPLIRTLRRVDTGGIRQYRDLGLNL